MPKFLVMMLLGIIALDIRLDIAACNEPGFLFGCPAVVGVWIVAAWFTATFHLEDLRANFANSSREQSVVLSTALISEFNFTLGGLIKLHATVILLLMVVWRLLLGTAVSKQRGDFSRLRPGLNSPASF